MAGVYVYFIGRLHEIKAEMRLALKTKPAEELDVLELSAVEFQRARVDDHEIKVNGKMYDLARVEKKGDRLMVYCLHDKAEDNLLSLLDSILKNASKDKKPVPGSGLSFLLAFIPVTSPEVALFLFSPVAPGTLYLDSFLEISRTVLGPPPRA